MTRRLRVFFALATDPRLLQDVQDTLAHCMDFGRMNMVPMNSQPLSMEDFNMFHIECDM